MEKFSGIGKRKSFYALTVLKRIDLLKSLGFYNLPIEKRIQYLETIGVFDVDAKLDPPTEILMRDDNLDYLKERPDRQDKYNATNQWAEDFIRGMLANGSLKIADVFGVENLEILRNQNQGAIVTINHFNPLDSFAVEAVIHDAGIDKKLFKVIREGNYTNFPEGPIADYFKFGRTLPLSQDRETMRMFLDSMKKLLSDGNLVLVAAEQAMWENYQKPKPMKFGAYRWATGSDVPVIPIFVGHTEKEDSSSYTMYIGTPIFPEKNKPLNENTVAMRDENFKFSRNMYEIYYGKKLVYDTQPDMFHNLRGYVRSTPGFEQMIGRTEQEQKDR